MWITQDEAVVMFARYCEARFGKSASSKARAKAKVLERRGDIEGRDVWTKVADEVDKRTKSSTTAGARSSATAVAPRGKVVA